MKNKIQIILVIGLILGAGLYIYNLCSSYLASSFHNLGVITDISKIIKNETAEPIATASYACDSGLMINAEFFDGATKPPVSPEQPPIPGGSVKLAFSDGRQFNLPQTISADGARYGLEDDSFVFWNKGNGTLIMENNKLVEKGCVTVSADSGGLSNIYASGAFGFSFRYPLNYTLLTDYQYQNLGPGKNISGIALKIPENLTTGTNLSSDSYLSVEEIPNTENCKADLFLPAGFASSTIMTDSQGAEYSFASSTDAAAGNRYEEEVYAFLGTNPCIAVRYFIHYGVLENYPKGAVRAFNREELINKFDSIRKTLIIAQP